MRRRDFIALASAAVAWPACASAQQPVVIGFLNSASAKAFAPFVAAFHYGLRELGFTEGENLIVEYRWAEGRADRLPALARELVLHKIVLFVATGGEQSAIAAKAATSTIPIIFAIGGDPVASGLVESLNRPGGNATGISLLNFLLEAKRLELIHEILPTATSFAVLLNPTSPVFEGRDKELREAAEKTLLNVSILHASTDKEIDSAFRDLAVAQTELLVVGSNPFFNSRREHIVALAARHRIPAIYEWREFAVSGGLMSYGASLTDAYRQVGVYTGRVLSGADPGELPVLQPTRFELVINLKTAEELGVTVPIPLLARADEVIE